MPDQGQTARGGEQYNGAEWMGLTVNEGGAFHQTHATYCASTSHSVDKPKQTSLFKQQPRSKLIFQTTPLIWPNKPLGSTVMTVCPQWAILLPHPGKNVWLCS